MTPKHTNRAASSADEAVSPVIGVILMVAIMVVLAATVWVWVQSFGVGHEPTPGTIGVSQGAFTVAPDACGIVNATFCVKWVVLSVSSGLDLRVKMHDAANVWELECEPHADLSAGETITCHGIGPAPAAGATALFVDHNANAVILTVTLHA